MGKKSRRKKEKRREQELQKQESDFFINISLRYAQGLKKDIGISEEVYHRSFAFNSTDSRGFYALSVLDDIIRATSSLMRWRELISEPVEEENRSDGIERNILESIEYEQKYWKRKLIEHLVNVIHFSSNNHQENYKLFHYFVCLKDIKSRAFDLETFFDLKGTKRNKNIKHQLDETIEDINSFASANSIRKIWFSRQSFPIRSNIKVRDIFKGNKELFERALELSKSDNNKRLLLGHSYYTNYGRVSTNFHASMGESNYNINISDLQALYSAVGMMNLVLLKELYQLLGVALTGDLKTVGKSFSDKNPEGLKKFRNQLNKNLDRGDLVYCNGYLCEIGDKIVCSKYNNVSYQVIYLVGGSPGSSYAFDYMPSQFIQCRILKKNGMKSYFKDILENNSELKTALNGLEKLPSKNEIYLSFKKTFIELEKQGILREVYFKKK